MEYGIVLSFFENMYPCLGMTLTKIVADPSGSLAGGTLLPKSRQSEMPLWRENTYFICKLYGARAQQDKAIVFGVVGCANLKTGLNPVN